MTEKQGTAIRRCILHIGDGDDEGDIRLFIDNMDRWDKVLSTKNRREQSLKSSKYDDMMNRLPTVFKDDHGYHSFCYKNFTAFSVPGEYQKTSVEPNTICFTRSKVLTSPTSPTGCLPKLCIFCNKNRKKVKGNWENLGKSASNNAEISIRDTAAALDDVELLVKIGNYKFGNGPDFVAKEIRYHHSCRKYYINQTRCLEKTDSSHTTTLNTKDLVFSYIKEYIQINIIDACSSEYVIELLDKYKLKFQSTNKDGNAVSPYNVQNLSRKIKDSFDEKQLTIAAQGTKKTIAFKTGIPLDKAYRLAKEKSHNDQSRDIWKCAMHLRDKILETPIKPLEEPISVQGIIEGEVKIPKEVENFFQIIYTGSMSRKDLSERKERQIKSSASDVVYACSGGKQLPGKQLALGMAMKSMTGSRRVVTVLNKFGHCASSETVRRMEMAMESTISESNSIVPSHIKKHPDLSTGLAWDNFDVNMETPSGADSIHHTYGICYQNAYEETLVENSIRNATVPPCTRKVKEFRKVDNSPTGDDLEPYRKKPKRSNFEFTVTTIQRPEVYDEARSMDLLWLILVNLGSVDIPMWVGWNSLSNCAGHMKQQVCYMKHIPFPPTRLDVVRETMKRSQEVSRECGQRRTIVTYDLAIAKIAKQLQSEESPQFDNMFVMFGAFHIMLNIYSSTGKIIEGSGGPYVLSEAKIIAPGSINQFLKGKMYNRCKRGHGLLATALHGLHMNKFIDDVCEIEGIADKLADLSSCVPVDRSMIDDDINHIISQYDAYTEKTLAGERGKTAQFWMQYVKIIDLGNILQRAIKCSDPQLFAYALFELSPIFFMANHINYARWMVLYSLELANLDPEMEHLLRNGGFSVNRTGKPFAQVPVDMALEQTINADAKNRLHGIMKYADVGTAVNRWTVTHSMKTELVNSLLDMCGISESSAGHKESQVPRMKRDNEDLKTLKDVITEALNPFGDDINKGYLFNIKTGRKVNDDAESYLLNIFSTGAKRRDNFIAECSTNPSRFEKPLKKNNILNFASCNLSKLNKSKKVAEVANVKGTRDLFGRLLFLSVTNDISIEKILEYPLLPQPSCFCHPDGAMYQSDKSVVFDYIIDNFESIQPNGVHTAIVDGMFLVRSTLNQHCQTFAAFARVLLMKALRLTEHRVDLCFDVYESPSVKDIKRKDRGNEDTERVFTFGPRQKFPTDIDSLMKVSEFKREFLKFILNEYEDPVYVHILGTKVLFCAVDNICKKFHVVDGLMKVENVTELYGYHLEADTRVAFHAFHADSNDPGNIVIRANDTDILVIMLCNAMRFNSCIWLDSGLDYNNSRKVVSITDLSESVDHLQSLPGIYAFTGNDYMPSFHGKGKIRPMKVMKSQERFIDAFKSLGEDELNTSMFDAIEEFACHLYGYKREKDIHKVLARHFELKCRPKKSGKPLDSIKSADPKGFPPCRAVLREQIKRAWFVSRLYKTATTPYPAEDCTEIDYGWQLSEDNEYLDIKWFTGDQVPPAIEAIEKTDMSDDENIENESDYSDIDDDEIE